jgi:hypothetical protein
VRAAAAPGKHLLFVNKKKQKNYVDLCRVGGTARGPGSKGFLVLFFKKERLDPGLPFFKPTR